MKGKTFRRALVTLVPVALFVMGAVVHPASAGFLSFSEGNPGLPGDEVFVSGVGFRLAPTFPLAGLSDGFTITVYPPANVEVKKLQVWVTNSIGSGPCVVGDAVDDFFFAITGTGTNPNEGMTTFNGVTGFFGSVPQSFLEGFVADLNIAHPGCGIVLGDLSVFILFPQDTASHLLESVDAAAILPGQNAVPSPTSPLPVVLIHGFCGDSDSFGMLDSLLEVSGVPVLLFDYSSESSATTIRQLASAFGSFVKQQGKRVDVIAHSMGGLIARAWMAGLSDPLVEYEGEIGRLVLIGVLNYGAQVSLANRFVGALLDVFGGCAADGDRQQLYFGSELVTSLNSGWANLQSPSSALRIAPESILIIAGTQSNIPRQLRGGFECENNEGCDDGVVQLSSAALPEVPEEAIRYLPYRHADVDAAIGPAGSPTLPGVTGPEHGTWILVRQFLLGDGSAVPNLYVPPHRRGDTAKAEGLVLVELPGVSRASIRVSTVELVENGSGRRVARRSYAVDRNGRNRTMTLWGVGVGTYDITVRGLGTTVFFADVSVEAAKPIVIVGP